MGIDSPERGGKQACDHVNRSTMSFRPRCWQERKAGAGRGGQRWLWNLKERVNAGSRARKKLFAASILSKPSPRPGGAPTAIS